MTGGEVFNRIARQAETAISCVEDVRAILGGADWTDPDMSEAPAYIYDVQVTLNHLGAVRRWAETTRDAHT